MPKKKGDINMDKSIALQQSVMEDVVSLMGDNEAMKKLQKYLRKLISENEKEMSKSEKAEVLDDIRQGLIEVRLVKKGKLNSRPVEELLNEL